MPTAGASAGYPLAMLDPRIYRSALVVVALAVIVFAFSLRAAQGPLGTSLSPGAFNGQNAYATMTTLSQRYPDRRPGSVRRCADRGLRGQSLSHDGYSVSTSDFRGPAPSTGPGRCATSIAERAGQANGTVVVVAHRDASGRGAAAEMSGTAVLLELGRVLAGETQNRSIVLVSTSGSAGAAGAAELARTLPGPIDAVISPRRPRRQRPGTARSSFRGRTPTWSPRRSCARPWPRQLSSQAALGAGGNGLGSQFLHLSFPMASTEQAPFGGRGMPAVLLSLSGERPPAADEPDERDPDRRARPLGGHDDQRPRRGPDVAAPSSYLLYSGQMIPAWAVRLLVLALILPCSPPPSTASPARAGVATASCAGSCGCWRRRCRSRSRLC